MVAIIENKKIIPLQLEEEFQFLLGKTFSAEPDWLKEKRKESFEKFLNAGIPTRKNEEYKYTDVRKFFAGTFSAVHNDVHNLALDYIKISVDKNSVKLVFVNGWLYKDSTLSATLPKGVVVGSMANDGLFLHRALLEKYLGSSLENNSDAFVALNTALWFDGAFIYLPANIILEKTIEIIHICTGENELLASPRHLIIAEKNSEAHIIEHSISLNVNKRVIVNSVAEVFAEEDAKLNYYKIQNENSSVFQLHNTQVVQKKNSHFDTNTITLDSNWVRNTLNISIEGENCETHLNGLFITLDSQFVDNHTRVYHGKAHCQSNQLYKGILDGKSTGVFNGKIFVERDAQKTNAYQSSKNILLTDDATINTKPELEIYADDVKCSHGSSTGKIDEDALFYLRSRGLGEASARRLLLNAFANDILNTIQIESLKNYLEELVNSKLEK
ncbi:MAG: Fe-S cluster assembly protein SufD [Bacteroidetes bacterium]|nr:Fe-S cluster assembly protein SufD [Bacteroidota bacterium]